MRLIDADALREDIETINYVDYNNYSDTIDFIDDAPTIEAEPVRHGEWRKSRYCHNPTDKFVCSVCYGLVTVSTFRNRCMYKYCPNCGAKMVESEEEND